MPNAIVQYKCLESEISRCAAPRRAVDWWIKRGCTHNKCLWLDACNINPCITAFIAMNSHPSQAAGSGDQSDLAPPRDTDADMEGNRNEQLQQHIRTVRGRNVHTDGRLSRKDLDAQMVRDETVHEAPSGTDSSGMSCATRSHNNKVADLAIDRSMVGGKHEWRNGADDWSDRHSISKSVSPYVSGGPQAARSSVCGLLSNGSSLVGTGINSARHSGQFVLGQTDPVSGDGSSFVGYTDSKDTNAMTTNGQSERSIYVSASDVFVSDLNGYYGQDYLEAYDFTGYGYNAQVTRVVDFFRAVRTPPANNNKYQKRSGAKATKKLEQLESVGHELNPKEATVFRALSARANYLAQDRVDIAYSSKDLCR